MNSIVSRARSFVGRSIPILAAAGAWISGPAAFAGTWTALAHPAPGGVNLMLLLPDGTVMCANNDGGNIGNAWYRLTPDVHGSYVNGTWTTLASSQYTRLYYPSQVMKDGRVFVAGGEYGTGGPRAEVYDPQTNSWTNVTPPSNLWNPSVDSFYDCNSEILSDGKVLVMPVFPHTGGVPLRYDPATNTWSNAGQLFRGTYQDEATWVKLPDDSILTIDPFGTNSERFIPATNSWVDDGIVPVSLYDPFGFELGGAALLPDGRAFFLGSTGHTALYTPSGTTSPGTWVAGPDIPGNHGTPDAPCAMMVTGNILCAVSPVPSNADHFPSPTSFYEYDPVANAFNAQNGPAGSTLSGPSYQKAMLDLPNGTVLFSFWSTQLYVYQPSGVPLPAGKPTITSLIQNGDGSYHLVGTGLNGISEGASYGDDLQMNSNYPLVRVSDGAGNVYYGRTYNWSSTSVRTGSAAVSTEFRLPANVPPNATQLVLIGNGFASDPYSLSASYSYSCFGDGTDQFCPCVNFGLPGHGCENSGSTGGALLFAAGSASLANDTVHFTSSGEMPTALSVVLQGTISIPAVPYGDGLRCASGTLKRLFTHNAVGGVLMAPQAGDPSVSFRSAALGDPLSAGATRIYQVYYRDPDPTFCSIPGSTFNVSNAATVLWSN